MRNQIPERLCDLPKGSQIVAKPEFKPRSSYSKSIALSIVPPVILNGQCISSLRREVLSPHNWCLVNVSISWNLNSACEIITSGMVGFSVGKFWDLQKKSWFCECTDLYTDERVPFQPGFHRKNPKNLSFLVTRIVSFFFTFPRPRTW